MIGLNPNSNRCSCFSAFLFQALTEFAHKGNQFTKGEVSWVSNGTCVRSLHRRDKLGRNSWPSWAPRRDARGKPMGKPWEKHRSHGSLKWHILNTIQQGHLFPFDVPSFYRTSSTSLTLWEPVGQLINHVQPASSKELLSEYTWFHWDFWLPGVEELKPFVRHMVFWKRHTTTKKTNCFINWEDLASKSCSNFCSPTGALAQVIAWDLWMNKFSGAAWAPNDAPLRYPMVAEGAPRADRWKKASTSKLPV